MNNIYKVIWSKAKNCYVVVSEIARSHTKSASGSEKIGEVARHALLALGAACAIACGGFVNVGAVEYEHVDVQTTGTSTATVYTKNGTESYVDHALTHFDTKTQVDDKIKALKTGDVATNKDNITALQTTTTDHGQKITANTTQIANNTAAIAKKIDTETADARYAAKADLIAKADATALDDKADKTAVAALEGRVSGVEGKVTTLEGTVGDASSGLVKDVADLRNQGNTLNTALGNKADQSDLDAANEKINANEGKITNLETKTGNLSTDGKSLTGMDAVSGTTVSGDTVNAGSLNVTGEISNGNGVTTTLEKINASMEKTNQNADKVADLEKKTSKIDYDAANDKTTINGVGISNTQVDMGGKDITNARALTATGKVTGDGVDAGTGAITGGSLTVTGKVTGNGVDAGTGDITTSGNVKGGTLEATGNATIGGALKATGKVTGDGVDAGTGAITGGSLTVTGKVTGNGVDAGTGDITTSGNVKGGTLEATGNATIGGALKATGKVTGDGVDAGTGAITGGSLTVTGKVTGNGVDAGTGDITTSGNVKGGTLETTGDATIGGNLKVTGTITTDKMIFGDKATNNYTEIDKGHITSKNDVLAGDATKKSSSMELDHSKLEVGVTDKDSNGHLTMTADQTSIKNSDLDGKNYSEIVADKDSVTTTVKDEKDNTTSTKSSATEIRNYAKDKDGNESSIVQTGKDITNTAQNGTITNDAQNIVNNASGNITNKANTMDTTVTGKAKESYGELETTVTGQATENFNGGLDTTVAGTEKHTVNGKQINTVTEGQENIISGGQTNTITGGQINNITGDQTTNVSGTQTTTATDINRNASSGMIDTIDNDYGTNTETKVAGSTTTEVSIKGTRESGTYIRGATEARDYIIKGTLSNSETKTAEATSTEITDGNGKTSATIQDKTQISGSVTNGTSSAVSNVKADSIDTAVKEGTNTSLISQKKDSITSAVGNGTTSTVIQQGDKDITIASNGGTVGIVGKDIINNATDEITNTAGTKITDKVGNNTRVIDQTSITDTVGTASRKIEDGKITDTAGDSTVTTENGKGTTFAKAGSAAYSTEAGAPKDTNIAGNHITTGRVDANELGVSDKDGANSADLSVEAGEGKGVKASASDGTTTGSLDVTADEVGSTVKDASGKGSTFKQRIDAIMMESKNVSIKAEETLTNEAKVITNKASEVINNEAININNTATGIITSKASEIKNQADKLISNKVGENTWENMENGKITTSIKDGAKQNLTQSDAAGTTQSTVDGGKSTVTIQNADGLADAVTDGTNTSVQNQTASAIAAAVKDGAGNENASVANATTSANTIKSGSKVNTVISTADGTSFINSEAAAPVGDGTEVKTTIKGNTITTGKVTMDYAEVMKDLGVRGNANITGKTTTGSLEVTSTSTLKGDVTMESNATVKKDLTVEGNTNLKNTKVDGTLDVTQKATFGDSVSIAKDLSVDGNATIKGDVTAKSYKVGDKTYISAAGINANDQKITNVADGSISEGSKDAVNGGQLYTVKNDLEGKVNKVGANAAAMANLHPMEFDPDSKWNVAAAIGNYGSETAAALGAFYRPNDNVMVNLSTAFGTGENMVGGGVSVRLGKGGNKLSREETNALKAQVADLTARMDALLSVLNPNMSKDFPDVPENHWAYEAVSRLAGNDIVQGYPDGEFHGERTMTRYEMAEIIYNALSRGAEAEKELVEEFKPELQAMAASEKATAERAEG